MSDVPPFALKVLPYRRRESVRHSQRVDQQSGEVRHFVRPDDGELCLLSEHDYFMWSELDGTKSFTDLAARFRERFGIDIAWEELDDFISELLPTGLIEPLTPAEADMGVSGSNDAGVPHAAPRRISVRDGAAPRDPAVKYPSRLGWRRLGREPFTWVIGDPDALFRRLAAILWPARKIAWLLAPLTFLSCLIMIKHAPMYAKDWRQILFDISWWPTLWVAEHVQNALTRVVEGVVICGYGGAVKQYRIRAFMGVLLRAFIDESSLEAMPVRCQLWAHASTLLVRLNTFNVGMWLWIVYYNTAPTVSKVGLYLSVIGAFTFLITALPLMPQEGYHLLATYLGQPNLMHRAWRLIGMGRSAPVNMTSQERWGLVFFGIGIAIISVIYVEYIWIEIDVDAVQSWGGFGAVIVVWVYIISGVYFYSLRKFAQRMRAMHRPGSARARRARRGAGQGREAKDGPD